MMKKIAGILLSSLLGAVLCAFLSAATFILLAMIDGTRFEEAFLYGIIVGVVGLLLGAVIGLVIGVGDLGFAGGALVGFLAVAAVVAVYVLGFSRPGENAYFLRESGVLVLVLALPTILTGVLTVLLRRVMSRA